MIETVIFDMDGVIIDSEPIHQEIQNQLFRELGISVTTREYESFIGRSSKNMWQELIDKHSLKLTVEEVLRKDKQLYHQKLREMPELTPIPGIPTLIDQLLQKESTLLLASSSSMESINLVLELFGLKKVFRHRVSGASLRYSKPHPEIFTVAADLANSNPDNCLVIEDSNHGVTAAKRAGMKCIGFQNANSGNQDLSHADLIVNDFRQLTWDTVQQVGSI